MLKSSPKLIKVYLTRYGTPLQDKTSMIRTYKNIMLVVTRDEKEPNRELHANSDFSISVTSQPHHSAAAIAIFLHEYYKGRELAMHFENAKYKLVEEKQPQSKIIK